MKNLLISNNVYFVQILFSFECFRKSIIIKTWIALLSIVFNWKMVNSIFKVKKKTKKKVYSLLPVSFKHNYLSFLLNLKLNNKMLICKLFVVF